MVCTVNIGFLRNADTAWSSNLQGTSLKMSGNEVYTHCTALYPLASLSYKTTEASTHLAKMVFLQFIFMINKKGISNVSSDEIQHLALMGTPKNDLCCSAQMEQDFCHSFLAWPANCNPLSVSLLPYINITNLHT